MRYIARLAAVLTDLGFCASVAAAYKGMRDVLVTNGGFCASGGPYAIAQGHQCTGSETTYILVGILGVFLFGALAAGANGWAKWPVAGTLLVGWAVLFGALGVNFLYAAINPPAHTSGTGGWWVCGVIFELMAIGGLIPAFAGAAGWIRRGGKPEPEPQPFVPLVRAAVPPK
jgi:hypothetical protein